MVYVARRKSDDRYYNFTANNWCKLMLSECYMTKEQLDYFREKFANHIDDYLIYTVVNPVTELYQVDEPPASISHDEMLFQYYSKQIKTN